MRHGQFERAETPLREVHDQAQSIAKSQGLEQIIPLAQTEEALGAFYARRQHIGMARACYQRLAELLLPPRASLQRLYSAWRHPSPPRARI
jgi:hypothetical protein